MGHFPGEYFLDDLKSSQVHFNWRGIPAWFILPSSSGTTESEVRESYVIWWVKLRFRKWKEKPTTETQESSPSLYYTIQPSWIIFTNIKTLETIETTTFSMQFLGPTCCRNQKMNANSFCFLSICSNSIEGIRICGFWEGNVSSVCVVFQVGRSFDVLASCQLCFCWGGFCFSYCWWKKSCTTWDVKNHVYKKWYGYLPYQLVPDFWTINSSIPGIILHSRTKDSALDGLPHAYALDSMGRFPCNNSYDFSQFSARCWVRRELY